MDGVSPYHFLNLAEALGCGQDYAKAVFEDAAKLSAKGLPVIFTLNHLATLAYGSLGFLHLTVKRAFDPYRHYTIPKRDGRRRRISSPNSELAAVQDFIKESILDSPHVRGLVSDSVFSYKKDRSIADNARVHLGAKWLVRIDLRDFFESFYEKSVYEFFKELGYAPLLSFELARLVTWPKVDNAMTANTHKKFTEYCNAKYKLYSGHNFKGTGSLPQGASTSPGLSNVLFRKADAELERLAERSGCAYSRYADDLFFSSSRLDRDKAVKLVKDADLALRGHGFSPNCKKTRICGPGAKKIVTGILVNGKALALPKEFRNELKKQVFFTVKNGLKKQAAYAGSSSPEKFLDHLYGKINFARQVDPKFAAEQTKILSAHTG